MTPDKTPDVLVIGGGVVGLTLALEVRRRFPDRSVVVIEKEGACGQHASGLNSGVLHAGFYYTADSLKARFAARGNRLMTEYCLERGLPINRAGKLVVAKNEAEHGVLRELLERGRRNGVELALIGPAEARTLEPRIRTEFGALYSPTTATVDPAAIMESLARELMDAGGAISTDTAFRSWNGESVTTSKGDVITPGFVINAAGAYADRVAREFGFAQNLTILPFRGRYLVAPPNQKLSLNVYPVPDLRMPVLGLHFTVTANNAVTIGPTAFPAGWREHYGGVANFKSSELVEVAATQAMLWLKNEAGFRHHAIKEIRKLSRSHLLKMASNLIDDLGAPSTWRWGHSGIRAQLFNTDTRNLEMDFIVERGARSLHVLNAVSPAFTSSLAFAEDLVSSI